MNRTVTEHTPAYGPEEAATLCRLRQVQAEGGDAEKARAFDAVLSAAVVGSDGYLMIDVLDVDMRLARLAAA